MGIKDFFKKKKDILPDPVTGLNLSELQTGYYVDFDMKTWEVSTSGFYDWGSRDFTYEWQLKSYDDTIYLEKEPDDEDYWCISRKISVDSLGSGITDHIKKHEDPPERITFGGIDFHFDEFGGGKYYRNKNDQGKEVLKWDYTDESGLKLLSIEQWGENDFEASTGNPVEEYQFTNILPGKTAD